MKYKIKSNLRVLMAKKNIKSKTELSLKTGVSRPTLIKIEKGEVETLKYGLLKTVCEELNCSIDELITLIPEE